jgi:exosortase A
MNQSELSNVATSRMSRAPAMLHSRWNTNWPWLPLLLCSVALLVSFRRTFFLMANTWIHSRTYSHCFLILPLFLYLIWDRRKYLRQLKPYPNYGGVPLLAGLNFVWILGNLGEVRFVQELALVSILIAIVWTLFGTVVVRALTFPLLFLFFAVPFGTSLIKPLQDFTAWFVIHALTISHIPAVLENHTISLPNGVWAVAEACSGIRFLLTSLVLGTVFSFLMYRSPIRRTIFMCASVIVPVIGNGLRAYGIITLAYVTNNRLAAGVDHIVYGGVFVVLIQLLLMVVGLRWRQSQEPVYNTTHSDEAAKREEQDQLPKLRVFVGATSLVIILVITAPVFAAKLWSSAPYTTTWPDPPVRVTEPWLATTGSELDWKPEQNNPERTFDQGYQNAATRVEIDWTLYSGRRELDFGMTPDGTGNTEWTLTEGGVHAAVVNGQHIQVSRSLMESNLSSLRIWTWYFVGGEHTASRGRVRFLQAKARLLERSASVVVIRVGTNNRTNAADAEYALQDFLLHTSFLTPAVRPTGSLTTMLLQENTR